MRQPYYQLLLSVAILFLGVSHATTTDYYVSPTGSDMNSGLNPSSPLLTPNWVQHQIETLGPCSTRGLVVVHFMTGTYYLGTKSGHADTWTIPAADTCSANSITYTNFSHDAGVPVISGGVNLGGTGWTNSGSLYWKPLPAWLNGSYSPEAMYYNGVRRFRTRFGATAGGDLSNLLPASFPLPGSGTGRIPSTSPLYDRFTYTHGDWPDTIATATSAHSNYSGWNPTFGTTLQQPAASPCYSTQTQSTTLGGDIEVIVFEKWTVSRQRISCVDMNSRVVYLQGAITTQTTDHGYISGHRYLIENFIKRDSNGRPILLPGQFFIDRTTTPYTLYYEVQSGENPAATGTTVVVPTLTGSTSGAVLAATGIQNVTFSNLTFAHDNYFPPTAGYSGAQSDTQLGMMVSCLDCSSVTWTGNTFTQTTGHALELQTSSASATPTSNVINGNYFLDLGGDGIMYGNPSRGSDSPTNILNNGQIENNLVQGYGRMYPGSSGIEHPAGSGTVITTNDVNDGYQTGIGVCIPHSGPNCDTNNAISSNIQVTSNHVWNIGKGVTDDMGGIYLATYSSPGNEVYNNKVQDVNDAQVNDSDGYGGIGIYLDTQTGGVDVENNLVFRTSWFAAQNTAGPVSFGFANTWKNNIFSYSRVAMFDDGFPNQPNGVMPLYLVNSLMNNVFYFDGNGTRSLCPGTGTIEQNNAGCSFNLQAACTVTTGVTFTDSTVSQQWDHNVYYNPNVLFWGSGSNAFHSIKVGATACSSAPPPSNQQQLNGAAWRSSQGQDLDTTFVTTSTQMFTQPFCTLSTAALCEQDPTHQDDYSVASGYTFPSGTFSILGFNALTAGRTSAIYPGCLSGPLCPVIDTFPTLTFSPTSTSITTLTNY